MRPIILGMNNPHSTDPADALSPTDPGSAGQRLWKMSCMSIADYSLAFERRNLVNERRWRRFEATAAARDLRDTLHDRSVVVLGDPVWTALKFMGQRPDPCRSITCEAAVTYYFVPHPSGRNFWYNDPENRKMVGGLLRRLAR